jgi:hypothetical protein
MMIGLLQYIIKVNKKNPGVITFLVMEALHYHPQLIGEINETEIS